MTPEQIDDLLVESMARAIGSAWKMGPWDAMDAEYQETFRAYASAAFAAQRITLKSAGLFIGPEEATPAMKTRGYYSPGSGNAPGIEAAGEVWKAMVAEWIRGENK